MEEKLINIINNYRQAHILDENGYSAENHSFCREDVIFHMYEIMLIFRKAFQEAVWNEKEMSQKKVLEIGTAWGLRLNQLLGFNFEPENMYGIDLMPEYIQQAKASNPKINYSNMSATNIEYSDDFFDCSFAVMVLSAMIDEKIIADSLAEMCRVSKDFVLIIDCFEKSYMDKRNNTIYYKGIDEKQINRLSEREDVEKIVKVGSFWSTSNFVWKIYAALKNIGLESIAYAIIVRCLARHSHKAIMIKLK